MSSISISFSNEACLKTDPVCRMVSLNCYFLWSQTTLCWTSCSPLPYTSRSVSVFFFKCSGNCEANLFLYQKLQISYRLFDLTNTLKVAFVPSKDDKRLVYNTITAVVILTVLYALSFVFLKLPLMLVSVLPAQLICLGTDLVNGKRRHVFPLKNFLTFFHYSKIYKIIEVLP